VVQVRETLHDKVNPQQTPYETMFIWSSMKEGTPLKIHFDEFNSILMQLYDVDVKIKDEDATMILLTSLPPFIPEL